MRFALVVLIFVVGVSGVVINRRQRFPGPYCSTRSPQQCCPDRDDTCTVPIQDSLCYCDQFCAIHNAVDCCPDYEDVCSGILPTTPPSRPPNECVHQSRLYQVGQSVKKDCNQCLCVAVDGVQKWSCETEVCINNQNLVDRVNAGRYGWTATTYSRFDGVSVRDGLRYYLGTDQPRQEVIQQNPLQIDPRETFEISFDAREKWLSFIHPAMDQGRCAASWAFSTVTVAADRWAIQSEGRFTDQLAVQSMLSCDRFVRNGCSGQSVVHAWYYLQKQGAVAYECYKYTSGETGVEGECRDVRCDDDYRHKTTPPYRVKSDERHIMKEIKSQGPVQAIITVHPDFYLYERGIYSHSKEDSSLTGTHSVKIIGWGEENGVKYWMCVNSWGRRWGEDGMFKIRRGANEIGIEDFVIGVWASVERYEI